MPTALDTLSAAMENAFPFPLILSTSRSARGSKVKIEGEISAVFADHNYLLVEATRHAEGSQMVSVDEHTKVRWKGRRQPESNCPWDALSVGDEVHIDGLQTGPGRLLATRIVRRRGPVRAAETS